MIKNLDRWIGSYFFQQIGRLPRLLRPSSGPTHIIFTCCDHFEPDWGQASAAKQIERINRWLDGYPRLVDSIYDADGCRPRHSFFYPAEVYVPENLELLSKLVKAGYGEVEIHLHHDGDTAETLAAKLKKAKEDFIRHGLLSRRRLSGQIRFGFIHGNWALNNSRRDRKWCGVNDESRVLGEAGCYADFTFPSAPSETQPRMINSIYYTSSTPSRPKSHNRGLEVKFRSSTKAHLMIIQGPLALNWKNPTRGIFPRIENADITGQNHPTPDRVDLWVNQRIGVKGKPDWVFIKVHTHGAQEANMNALLGAPMRKMYDYLDTRYNDGSQYKLHYASAREMYNIIEAAEAGETGEPGEYRDYILEKNI